MLRNFKWTFDAEQFQSFGAFELLYESCFLHYPNNMSSLLYIEVWKIRCEIASASKRVVWSFDQSPMISFLIWLLFYEGSISNSFQVCRNIVAGMVVILVLLQGQKQSSGDSGCTVSRIVLCQRSLMNNLISKNSS